MAREQTRGYLLSASSSAGPSGGDPDLFRAAVEASDIAMMITGPELGAPGPTIGFVNQAMAVLTGYVPGELVGRSTRLLERPKSDRKEARRRIRTLLREGTYRGEVVNRRKDGSMFVASWTIKAIPKGDGGLQGWLVAVQDTSQQQTALDALAAVEARHQALLEGIPHLVWQSRDDGQWCAASPQWTAFTGQSEKASQGAGWREMVHPEDRATTDDAWQAAMLSGVMAVEHRVRHHDGAYRWFQTRALPVSANATRKHDRLWIGTSTDVDAFRGAEEQIRFLAFHDVLTNAGNRAMLQGALERMTLAAPKVVPFNVLYLDVDDFKSVNDQLGHRGGDEVLREVSRELMSWSRDGDIVARIGGDEFVLLQAKARPRDGVSLAERIKGRLGSPLSLAGQKFQVSASIGVASFPEDGSAGDELIRRADLALFAAKSDGRGCVRRFEPHMETVRQERLALQMGLRQAIERGEFTVVYQPVIETSTGFVQSYEALARWDHPQRGAVPPDVFIPVAEECGLIEAIGEWVLLRACLDAADDALGGCRVAVNLSPAQFRSASLTQTVMNALEQTGLPPDRLELEVTERLLMDSADGVDRTLREIKAAGVRIALDDFGTGYSNLGYLCRFPFDRLKIDRSFVRQMAEDDGARAVVSGIIALAHSLRLEVTAEGVETEQQLRSLREMGCDQVQGYLLGRPEPAAGLRPSR